MARGTYGGSKEGQEGVRTDGCDGSVMPAARGQCTSQGCVERSSHNGLSMPGSTRRWRVLLRVLKG